MLLYQEQTVNLLWRLNFSTAFTQIKSFLNIYHTVIAFRVLGTLAWVRPFPSFPFPNAKIKQASEWRSAMDWEKKNEKKLFSPTKFRAAVRHFLPCQVFLLADLVPFACYAAYERTSTFDPSRNIVISTLNQPSTQNFSESVWKRKSRFKFGF